jgi:Zn-dependent protease with chaperone function
VTEVPRLNPFAFPSDTAFRFVLLIVSVLGSSLLLYAAIFEALPPTREFKRIQYEACARQFDPTDFSGSYAERLARVLAYGDCTSAADRVEALWVLGGVALVLAVAAGLYWTSPRRRIRQHRLVPLDSIPELTSSLSDLCREAQLQPPPAFVWSPLSRMPTGLAFGNLKQQYVSLSGGLVKQFYTDRPAFRAVVLHELAHLRNADVDRTYVTVALWQAFLLAALLPFAASQVVSGRTLAELADVSWRIAPLAALVYLTRNAVLRAREVYADVRASTWDGPSGALRRTLEALPRPTRHWWQRLSQVHPGPVDRRRTLDDTRPLFDIHVWDALGTGLAAGIALPNVVVLLGMLVPMPIAITRPLTAALICAPLVVGVVGLGVWRATFAALAESRRPRGAGRAGAALGLGLVLGQELSVAAVEFGRGQGPIADFPVTSLNAIWGALLVVMLFLFCRWIAAAALAWLEVTADDPSPGEAYRIGLAIAAAFLAAWLGVLFFVYLAVRTAGNVVSLSDLEQQVLAETDAPDAATVIGSDPLVQSASATLIGIDVLAIVSIVALCAYPLAAWLWRHRRVAPTFATWAFLDPPPEPIPMPLFPPLRPGRALAVGIIAGLIYCVATFLVYLTNRADPEALAAWTQVGTIALAVVLQAVVALVVAVWLPRLSALHALFAALVSAAIMGLATLGILAAFGLLWDDAYLTLFFVSAFVIGGASVALPVALVAEYLSRLPTSRHV